MVMVVGHRSAVGLCGTVLFSSGKIREMTHPGPSGVLKHLFLTPDGARNHPKKSITWKMA